MQNIKKIKVRKHSLGLVILFTIPALFFCCKNSSSEKKQVQTDTSKASRVTSFKSSVFRDTLFEPVSIINLIATPEKFHNKWVSVHGFLVLEFEGEEIFLSESDYRHGIGKNSIWVSIDENVINKEFVQNFSYKYAIIRGLFDKDDTGHMGGASGCLKNIARIDLYDADRH